VKSLKLILTFFLGFAIFTGCEECEETVETSNGTPFEAPTAQEFNALQLNVYQNLVQTARLDVANGINFISAAGVTLFIPPDCLIANGTVVTGFVDLEFFEVFDRGDLLTTNTTTVGQLPTGELDLLISGGAFYINASQNGQPIDLICEGFLGIPTDLSGGDDIEMRPFDGTLDANGNLLWTEANRFLEIDGGPQGSTYFTSIASFGWFNVDKFANDPRPTTTVQVSIPQEFNQENTAVYLALVGEPNSLAYLYGELPIGLEAYFIFISEESGDFRYAIKTVTIEENQQLIFTRQETEVVNLSEITAIINALP
tara:strand:- start:85382 stop:86320 length:939 start_codon:yes stop_codon:yes gene_type:complete